MLTRNRRIWHRIPRPLLAGTFALALATSSASPAAAAVGDLDDTFDGDGKLVIDLSSGFDYFEDVVIQPGDEKIIGVGRRGSSDPQYVLMRRNPDGSPDTTFGGGDGTVFTNFGIGEDSATAVALDPDGKIIVVGDAPGFGGKFGVARYNPDGTPDTTFSGDGRTTTNFTTGYDFAWDVAIQPGDQKIVAVGRTGGADPSFAVVRYNENGTLDTTFSGDGLATVNLTTGEDNATAVAIRSNGQIVLAGSASGLGGQIGLARLRANGTLDSSFSGDGKLIKNLSRFDDVAWDVAIQPGDEKIVVGGRSGAGNGSLLALRYNVDGMPDTTFSGDGVAAVNVTSYNDFAMGLALQLDGNIVMAGTAANEFFLVTRFTATGVIDTSFADAGQALVNLSSGRDEATAVAIQADGAIVAVGLVSGSGGRIGMIRLLGT